MNFSERNSSCLLPGVGQLFILAVVVVLSLLASSVRAQNVGLPEGFSETAVATDIQSPVGMEISPDGRIFVLAGNVKRIEIFDDSGFLNEFIELPQVSDRGSGLLGLAFAPDFAKSGDVFITYITNPNVVPGPQRFRLSRFSSNGKFADVRSEVVIFEVDDIDPSQQLHQGGDLVVGADGKIYWALGDRVEGEVVSQSNDSLFGKLLRLNKNGTIPADNPFYAELEGEFRAIYANGLRNPYRMDKRLATGDIYMSDVGPSDWEELNKAEPRGNYGWPLVTGVANDPAFTDPALAYAHNPDGCAITGGTFYEPRVNQFPKKYHDKFFYGDHCFGWIAYRDMETGKDVRFMTGAHRLVEIKTNPVTGALYYLDREYAGDRVGRFGGIGRIDYVGGTIALRITQQPESTEASAGEDVNFKVLVTGQSPFRFQWFRNGSPLKGETDSSLSLENVRPGDNRSEYSVRVTDATNAVVRSDVAILSIANNSAPVAKIIKPESDLLYVAGEEYTFVGTATDAEDGALDASAFSWEIVFHHDDHTHPFIPSVSDVKRGTFVPPTNDETSPNVWYRIYLTVTDSDGSSTTVEHDIYPVVTAVSINTMPAGLELLVDGTPQGSPVNYKGVAGVTRVIEAPETQVINGQTWAFSSWSNGGERVQSIPTPLFDTKYVAKYVQVRNELPVVGLSSPAEGATVTAPVRISGTASDDGGISRVQLVIRNRATKEYWNGVEFVTERRAVKADLDSPGKSVTGWSYTMSPSDDARVKVTALARRTGGKPGKKQSANFNVVVEPFVEIISPEHRSRENNPVTFRGAANLDKLTSVKLIIKELGARNFWNGSEWIAQRSEVTAILRGGSWTYEFKQPGSARDVVVRATAIDDKGSRLLSRRVIVNVD